MLKRTFFLSALLFVTSFSFAQSWEDALKNGKATLTAKYFNNQPYAALTGKTVEGIEIEILEEFVKWAKEKKNVDINLQYEKQTGFNSFLENVTTSDINTIGLGSVTISEARSEKLKFSAPYLKNVSVLITAGEVKTAYSPDELKNMLSTLKPVTIKGSVHENYLQRMTGRVNSEVAYTYVDDVMQIPVTIAENKDLYGYIDIISFWKYLKKNDQYIKMHTLANVQNEYFGFIFPESSDWNRAINEFLESGFGFTATKKYREILQTHLGEEVIEYVELNR